MLLSLDPYRRPPPPPARFQTVDVLGVAAARTTSFVILFSLARVAACIWHGFDFEGFLAATIIALTLLSRGRSFLP